MPHVITQNCCNDAGCVDACPVDCIHPRPDEPGYLSAEMLYIDPDKCIDCGACIPMCPVDAIRTEADLEPKFLRYKDLNAFYASESPAPAPRAAIPLTIRTSSRALRVAIVGAGPAGLFAAEHLLTQPGMRVEVDVYDRLPTPWGLIRAGVAPDHQQTKAAAEVFRWTTRRPGFRYQLGVEVGRDITHPELSNAYHAVIYAVGASVDRHLGIPGEDLPGSHSATDFVAWYNGHPDHADQEFDLSGTRAVIIGNGNVALDVARILVSDPATLAPTDIADHALEALRHSNIREVLVVGRRGPAEAAYTTPELLGLANVPGVEIRIQPDEVREASGLKVDVLREVVRQQQSGPRQIILRYLHSPVEILGVNHVEGVRVVRNELQAVDGGVRAVPIDEFETVATGLVLRSIGYRGTALPDVPFDESRGVIPNVNGRVAPGVYATGWIKRGPSGVIGTNKQCARETAEALLEDAVANRLPTPPKNLWHIDRLLDERAPRRLDVRGWNAIDRSEREAGRLAGRPRRKFTNIEELIRTAMSAPR
ncbi:FAD-dependent oxidoreductase [Smaragdicoccus niigatensis]|uniref:FAD-dependent oxidoreductase n=1 Tax=Smaragdicoccus niigatensis TaxID=359359 RepID=UPI00037F9D6D|nr:FAD-dependent oxidoreductase [Smaragdicoccus niigatensis]